MFRKGNCWDNAAAESFPHVLKNETRLWKQIDI